MYDNNSESSESKSSSNCSRMPPKAKPIIRARAGEFASFNIVLSSAGISFVSISRMASLPGRKASLI